MSGRVRWERHRSIVGERVVLYVDGVPFGEANRFRGERTWFVGVDDTDVYDYVPRRTDATRWLLARAAGLAEVPRWQRVKRGGVEDGDARRPPTGWRRLMTVEICGDQVTVYERNRRRR